MSKETRDRLFPERIGATLSCEEYLFCLAEWFKRQRDENGNKCVLDFTHSRFRGDDAADKARGPSIAWTIERNERPETMDLNLRNSAGTTIINFEIRSPMHFGQLQLRNKLLDKLQKDRAILGVEADFDANFDDTFLQLRNTPDQSSSNAEGYSIRFVVVVMPNSGIEFNEDS